MSYTPNPQRYRDLPTEWRRLVTLMQDQPFCELRDLHITGGEPAFDPPPRIRVHVKFGAGPAVPNREHDPAADYVLKPQVAELVEKLTWVGDATVHSLVVKHGLPFTMDYEAVD